MKEVQVTIRVIFADKQEKVMPFPSKVAPDGTQYLPDAFVTARPGPGVENVKVYIDTSEGLMPTYREVRTRVLVDEQPSPLVNDQPAVWDIVMADFKARDAEGRRKYGTPLQPSNGRDALVDAYQEALDLVVYLRQAIYERDGR